MSGGFRLSALGLWLWALGLWLLMPLAAHAQETIAEIRVLVAHAEELAEL